LLVTPGLNKELVIIVTVERLKEFFDACFDGLFVYAFTIVKNEGEAKDIAQAAFVTLWEKRAQIESEQSVKAFLFTTVYHLAMNAVRNAKSRQRHHQRLVQKQSLDTAYTAEQQELRKMVWNAIDELPRRCREVFIKSRFDGMKYAEIAKQLDISEKTVDAQMVKAMKILKEKLRSAGRVILLLSIIINN
jgi:RNA polymerase sigma-70 factor, ECF subfamily